MTSLLCHLLPLAQDAGIWLPRQRSTIASTVDNHFSFIYWVSVIFFVLIVILMVYFMFRYQKPPGEKAEGSTHHNLPIEVTWTVIPTILVVIMFWVGFKGFTQVVTPPADAYTINVTAQQWQWFFQYPENGAETDELHVPPEMPIRLVMRSVDVLHAFYVPEMFVKQDIVPGRLTELWFEPTNLTPDEMGIPPEGVDRDDSEKGFNLYCAEYCGQDHSNMRTKLFVHETLESFETWLQKANEFPEEMPLWERGAILYKRKGCKTCHMVHEGQSGNFVGPEWYSLWGMEPSQHMVDVPSEQRTNVPAPVTEDYLMESIRDPMARIRSGYPAQMPIKAMRDEEIIFLIEFIKSLPTPEAQQYVKQEFP